MFDNKRKLVSLVELSRRLHISAKWLKAEALAGQIPHLKAGRKLLFNIEAVECALVERSSKRKHDD